MGVNRTKCTVQIVVLAKRQYTGKDLIDDQYGRLYEIPESLAASGNLVTGFALSYQNRPEGCFRYGLTTWHSYNLGWPFSKGLPLYLSNLRRFLRTTRPDFVWASSDAIHAILAWFLCRPLEIPFVVDLYDNYESFRLTRLPGVKTLFRAACRAASSLTVVSHNLQEYIVHGFDLREKPILVLGNAVNQGLFFPRSKQESRCLLKLPWNSKLMGTAGSLTADRGIDDLFRAFLQLAERDPSIFLVIAGARDKTPSRYRHHRIIDLGIVDLNQVPYLYSALDIAVICNKDSSFGRYCFPQKFYEIVACGTPLLASDVGEMRRLLAHRPDCLFPPDSPRVLAERLADRLQDPRPLRDLFVPSWTDRANALLVFLQGIQPSS